jgi:hypothetical protein
MTHIAQLAGLLGVGVVLTACVAAAGSSPSLAPQNVTVLTLETALPRIGLTLYPPGVATANVDAQAAFALCRSGVAECPDSSPVGAQLALATDPGPAQLDSTGKLNPLMNRRLVWALTWDAVTCHSSGGPVVLTASGSPGPSVRADRSCNVIAFVDASTGDYLYTVTYELP